MGQNARETTGTVAFANAVSAQKPSRVSANASAAFAEAFLKLAFAAATNAATRSRWYAARTLARVANATASSARGGAPRSVRTHPEPGVNPKNVMNVVVVAGRRDGDVERVSVSVVAVPSVVDLPSLTSARVSSSVSTDHPAHTPRTEPPSAASGSSRDESPLESEL